MPFYVVKKETEKGYNIRKESFNNLENDLKRSLKDIKL
jgi:hypothetical protein